MPANYTQNYQLNQWAADDLVQRTDFNADNAKIDAALKAAADARSTLSAQVAAKAAQSALTAEVNTRTSQVNTLNNQVAKLGNCQIYTTSYVGDDATTKTLTFPQKPLYIFIISEGYFLHMVYGAPRAICSSGQNVGTNSIVTWSGNSVSWTHFVGSYNSKEICNSKLVPYYVIALMDASEE